MVASAHSWYDEPRHARKKHRDGELSRWIEAPKSQVKCHRVFRSLYLDNPIGVGHPGRLGLHAGQESRRPRMAGLHNGPRRAEDERKQGGEVAVQQGTDHDDEQGNLI